MSQASFVLLAVQLLTVTSVIHTPKKNLTQAGRPVVRRRTGLPACVGFLFLPMLLAAEYTTFIGDANPYQVARVVADSAGNTYIAATRLLDQASDIIVMKLDPAGNTLFFRDISGKGSDVAADIAIDSTGNVYIGGSTSSVNFPIHNAMQSTPGPGFLLKLSADLSQLVWSTYFREAINALAIDSGGNVYVTGSTDDPQFPVTPGLPNGAVNSFAASGAFLTKISAAGDHIVYSAIISGTETIDCNPDRLYCGAYASGVSLAVDVAGNAYLAGNTDTLNLPTTSGALLTQGMGAFIAKVKADGSGLSYLTYVGLTNYPNGLGSTPANTATAIACDAEGNVYLTGATSDPHFPATTGAWQTTYAGPANPPSFPLPPTDAFAMKLNPAGSAVVWGTYLGGSAADAANSIAVDASHQVWMAGTTASPEFPNAQGWSQGNDFIAGLDASGAKLVYAARYPNDGASRSIAIEANGLLHVSGPTGIVSTVAPANAPLPRIFGLANAANGPLDGRVAAYEVVSIYGPHIGPSTPIVAVPDSNGFFPVWVSGYQVVANLGQPLALPLLYVSDSQINAVVPFNAESGGPIHVISPSGTTPDFPLTVMRARPEVFRNLDDSAIALNQDGTLNAANNPARTGSDVTIWLTGSGSGGVSTNAGQIATSKSDYYCCGIQLYGLQAQVTYAGFAPGAVVGVSQVTFQVPSVIREFNSYGIPLQAVAKDGSLSRPVTLYVSN